MTLESVMMSAVVYAETHRSGEMVACSGDRPDAYLTWTAPLAGSLHPLNVEAHYARDGWIAHPMGFKLGWHAFEIQAETFFCALA